MLLALIAAGCASAIPRESLKQAAPGLTFDAVMREPDRYIGKVILVGGRILAVNVREGDTWVEVMQHPLDWRERPKDTDVT
ncbi:MAG TPA: Slp family lipoprotein, partial [Thermodesulfobacteriota bacterium]|nr:Slp family lipoprotein [Thermodesulfobacteriota bacterium]